MTKKEWEEQKELSRNTPDEPEEIPYDMDDLMTYNGVSWSDFF